MLLVVQEEAALEIPVVVQVAEGNTNVAVPNADVAGLPAQETTHL
jgi:hypothetical protein